MIWRDRARGGAVWFSPAACMRQLGHATGRRAGSGQAALGVQGADRLEPRLGAQLGGGDQGARNKEQIPEDVSRLGWQKGRSIPECGKSSALWVPLLPPGRRWGDTEAAVLGCRACVPSDGTLRTVQEGQASSKDKWQMGGGHDQA